ncbi:Variant-specific surface protein, partial [Giardia duodenalis]
VCKVGGTLARLPLHVQGRISRLVGEIAVASQLWRIYSSSNMDLHPSLGGCYNIRAAPGSGGCREARDGACVRYAEEARAEAKEKLSAGACEEISGGGPNTCKTCRAVIGGVSYCSACNVDSSTESAPVDGQCTTENNECPKKSAGVCTQCDHASFMFQGGCYRTGQDPGQAMCTNAASGVCNAAAAGYFLPPTEHRDNLHQSVIPCGDVEEIAVKDNKKYKGVLHCAQCNTPNPASDTNAVAATCTACEDGYFVASAACTKCHESCLTCEGGNGADKCKSCTANTYFLGAENGQAGKCVSCGDASGSTWKGVDGCLKCTKSTSESTPATCTECQADRYLKDGSPASCVTAATCNTGYFPNDNAGGKKKCLPCSDNNNGGIENCAECSLLPSASGSSTILITCTKCSKNNLSPLKNECMTTCPAGTYETGSINKVCTPCHTSCSSCSDAGESSCTACYPGHVLNKTDSLDTGTCIPECTGKFAENCGANQCTAVLGGSKYCSKCKSGYVPVDGLCVSTTARAPNGCTPSNDGTCSTCTDKYFLQSGGCYLSTAYPGSTLCSQAASGKCTQCANGQTQSSGSCPACPAGCSKCSGSTPSQQCSECLAGYYKSGTKCVKCDTDDSNIKGVPNCISCAPPANNQGSVTCYVTQTPTVDPAGPSANKGGLSSGAIAGISVAVIAVVGGLVGFLCWWFICCGKA